MVGAAVVGFAGASVVMLGQVEVRDDDVAATRACGSAFDSIIDRSGWELWWARDLDEPDGGVRAALIRTQLCPDAINARIAIGAALAAVGVVLLTIAVLSRRGERDVVAESGHATIGRSVTRLGRVTEWVGVAMAFAGVVALVVLVADADSTLFLYTDRLVVAVVGLIVLVPTLALVVIGRVLHLVGPRLDREGVQGG